MRSWQVLRASFGKLAFQQRAQQFGHGHALREGRYLDARPHRGRPVEGQARGVEVAFLDDVGVALTNPRLAVRARRWTSADGDALAVELAQVGHRCSASVRAAISRAAAPPGAVSRASRPAAALLAHTRS